MTVLAIIPARGGSKGIPRKNIVPLAGRPLVAHTLEAARAAKVVTDILVSTDDDEIAAVCAGLGAATAYRRPAALAGDTASAVEAAVHALDWWAERQGGDPELLVLLQPTSPLRTAADIDGTVAALRRAGVESAISVHEMSEHPMECVAATTDGWRMLVAPPAGATGRQAYGARFHFINGAVYVVTPGFLRQRRAFMVEGGETALYVMDALRGIDIDEPTDLDLAEAILTHPRLAARLRASTVKD